MLNGLIIGAAGGADVTALLDPVKTDVMAGITAALPAAGAVFAAIAGIMVGIKLFKKISGARA